MGSAPAAQPTYAHAHVHVHVVAVADAALVRVVGLERQQRLASPSSRRAAARVVGGSTFWVWWRSGGGYQLLGGLGMGKEWEGGWEREDFHTYFFNSATLGRLLPWI